MSISVKYVKTVQVHIPGDIPDHPWRAIYTWSDENQVWFCDTKRDACSGFFVKYWEDFRSVMTDEEMLMLNLRYG